VGGFDIENDFTEEMSDEEPDTSPVLVVSPGTEGSSARTNRMPIRRPKRATSFAKKKSSLSPTRPSRTNVEMQNAVAMMQEQMEQMQRQMMQMISAPPMTLQASAQPSKSQKEPRSSTAASSSGAACCCCGFGSFKLQKDGFELDADTQHSTRSIQRARGVHQRMCKVAQAKPGPWTLIAIFAGRVALSDLVRRVGKWNEPPPHDVLYGLDLRKVERQDLLKDVIKKRRPDVVTLSVPRGPWSSWQREKKEGCASRTEE